MRICIRAQYPATGQYDWWEALKALHPVTDIELAFHSPDSFVSFVNPGEVILAIKTQGLSVPTIHMAHANLSNLSLFMRVFTGTLKIAQALHCTEIIVHPSYGSAPDLDAIFDGILLPLLEDHGCNVLWETFLGKRRILTAWEQLAEFCRRHERSFICYDICHMQRRETEDVIEDIDIHRDLIRAFHFSNWRPVPFKQHLPVNAGILDYHRILDHITQIDFEGTATLEYLPEFHHLLVTDALGLRDKLYKRERRR